MKDERFLWGGFALAIIAYLLPWVANEASGLTMGAYDLAEFLSKKSMYESSIYNPVLALRGQLLLLSIFIVVGAKRPFFTADWWLRAITGLLLIIAQLPALNMLPSIGVDVNRQQQVILAGISAFTLIIGLSGILSRWQSWIRLGIVLLAIGTSLYGVLNGIEIMKPYGLDSVWGLGLFFYLGILFVALLLAFSQIRRSFFLLHKP